jgi:phosphate transport system protein
MGELAVAQLGRALDAFERHDAAAAARTAAADDRLDAMEAAVEAASVRFIALRQPMADDLRRPICAMKIAMQLERCGDLAKSIAKRAGRMEGRPTLDQVRAVVELGTLAAGRLAAAMAAYAAADPVAALEVRSGDVEIDEGHEQVLRQVMAAMTADPDAVGVGAHLLFIAKNLERIGDHATNIAELVHYQVVGAAPAGGRPKL